MLIAFLALIAMLNGILGGVHTLPAWLVPGIHAADFRLRFCAVAWLLGVPWNDCADHRQPARHAPGDERIRRVSQLGPIKAQLDPRSFTIATYALCGFANFSSIAIQIGGIGALAPNRKSDLARLGLRAVVAGTMANFMSACIAGMLL